MQAQVTFGSFRFEPATARLWDNGAEVKLTRKAALVLGALLERPGEPVSKQELFASVWRGTVVSDDALVTCIQELRKALGDDSKQPLYIETRHRMGYRFAAPVRARPRRHRARAGAAPVRTAIAVLPFADMSPERDQDYLCEGLAEELIDALTHIDGLRVAARTSSFQFRGEHDLREVGRKLGVGSLLEGSVRKAGDRLRVTVQLIDVATGYHKWSEKFERDAGDVFAMQDEIAEKVATLLRGGELSTRERRAVRRQPTAIETYECFLRGRQRMHTMQQPHMDEARALYQRAIALDAEYAPAWAGLATLHALLYEWWGSKADGPGRSGSRQPHRHGARAGARRRASRARLHAVEPASLRRSATGTSKRRRASIRICSTPTITTVARRSPPATSRNPSSCGARPAKFVARISKARCCEAQSMRKLGRLEESRVVNREAVRRAERLLELNPSNGRVLSFGAGALHEDGQSERALEWARRAEALYPDDMGVIINGALLARAQLA